MGKFSPILLIVMFGNALFSQTENLKIADSLYNTGNYAKAIPYYAQMETPNAIVQLARTYHAMGNLEKAIHFFEKGIKRNGDLIIAQFELGKLYLLTKRNLEALELFQKLRSKQPENPEFLYLMGQSLEELDRSPEAIAAFKRGFKMDSTHLRSIQQLAKYYVTKRNLDSVLFYVDKGLSLNKNSAPLISLKAQAYYNARIFSRALPLFEELIKLGGEKPFVHHRLGTIYTVMTDYKKARDTYKRLLELDPLNPETMYHLGNAYYGLHKLDSATVFIDLSISLQQVAMDREYNTLARIAVEKGDLEKAIANYREAFRENPEGHLYKYEICFLTDQYYKDPKMKLECYRSYDKTFGHKKDYFSEFAQRRIRELTEEQHFTN